MTDLKKREDRLRERFGKERARVERMSALSHEEHPNVRARLSDLEERARNLEERIDATIGKAGEIYLSAYLNKGFRKEDPLKDIPFDLLKRLDRSLGTIRHDTLELHLGNLRRIAQALAVSTDNPAALDYLRTASDEMENHRQEVRVFFDTELPDGSNLRRRFLSLSTEINDHFQELRRLTRKIADSKRPKDLPEDIRQLSTRVETVLQAFKDLRRDFSAARVDVGGLVAQVCDWSREPCQEKGIELRVRVPRTQQFLAYLDPTSVRRIIRESIHNAMKHAFPPDFSGDRAIEVDVLRSDRGITLEVSDNGQGVRPEFLKDLGCVPRTSAKDGQGGQGCCILREIVDSLGGNLEWRSQPGRGTKLLFNLPA